MSIRILFAILSLSIITPGLSWAESEAAVEVEAETEVQEREKTPDIEPIPYHSVTGDFRHLELSKEQTEKIKHIQAIERARVRHINEQTRSEILANLTDKQKEKLAAIETAREEARRQAQRERYERQRAAEAAKEAAKEKKANQTKPSEKKEKKSDHDKTESKEEPAKPKQSDEAAEVSGDADSE